MVSALSHLKKKDKRLLILNALKEVGIADCIDKYVYECSGGEQQRAALAKIIIKNCDLILADEPTASLDSINKEAVLSILDSFCKQGKTVIVVSHDENVKMWSDCNIIVERRNK